MSLVPKKVEYTCKMSLVPKKVEYTFKSQTYKEKFNILPRPINDPSLFSNLASHCKSFHKYEKVTSIIKVLKVHREKQMNSILKALF